MTTMRAVGVVSTLVVGLVGGVAGSALLHVATPAVAHEAAMKPEAATIGTVDLTLVMRGLEEAGQLRKKLEDAFGGFQAEIKAVGDEMKKISDELSAMKDPKSMEALRLQARRAELEVTGRAKAESLQRLLDIQEGELLSTMFKKIVDASKRLAESQGYDVIVQDDRSNMPPEGTNERRPTARDVNEVVLSRRVLALGAARIDVTQQLIDMMNNEFKAGAK